jgi:hypothetical protein
VSWRNGLLALVCAVLAGCRTVPIPGPTVIDVPPGLSLQAVEVAVLAGIENIQVPTWYDPKQVLPQAQFDAMVASSFMSPAGGRSWQAGVRKDDVRYAFVDVRGHHLLVAIHLATDRLRIEFVESRDLLEADGRIHKKVPEWIDHLATHIGRELQRLSSRVGTTTPAAE